MLFTLGDDGVVGIIQRRIPVISLKAICVSLSKVNDGLWCWNEGLWSVLLISSSASVSWSFRVT